MSASIASVTGALCVRVGCSLHGQPALCFPSCLVGDISILLEILIYSMLWVVNLPFPSTVVNSVMITLYLRCGGKISFVCVIFSGFCLLLVVFFFFPKSSSTYGAMHITEAKATPTCIYALMYSAHYSGITDYLGMAN